MGTTNSTISWCAKSFMMCQRIGFPPTSTIGFGRNSVSSRSRVPRPPARMTAFIQLPSSGRWYRCQLEEELVGKERRVDLDTQPIPAPQRAYTRRVLLATRSSREQLEGKADSLRGAELEP